MHEREGARLGLDYTYVLIDFDRLGLRRCALGDGRRRGRASSALPASTSPIRSSRASSPLLDRPVARRRGDRRGQHGRLHATAGASATTPTAGASPRAFARAWPAAPLDQRRAVRRRRRPARRSPTRCWNSASRSLAICRHAIRAARRSWRERLTARFGAAVARRRPTSRPRFARADGVVNATPVGMAKYPGHAVRRRPAAAAALGRRHRLFPGRDGAAAAGRARSAAGRLPGTGMAVYQAVRAFELFTGIADAAMRGTRWPRHFEAGAAAVDLNEPFRTF